MGTSGVRVPAQGAAGPGARIEDRPRAPQVRSPDFADPSIESPVHIERCIAKLLGSGRASHATDPQELGPARVPTLDDPLADTGHPVGTLAYMAPKQWASEEVDGRTDLWVVGIMLFQMVTGEHPLAPVTPESLLEVAALEVPMPSVVALSPDGLTLASRSTLSSIGRAGWRPPERAGPHPTAGGGAASTTSRYVARPCSPPHP